MPEILDIQKVSVGPRYVTARVRVADDAPLTTDQDLIGTTRIYNLMPEICDHVCLGDEVQLSKTLCLRQSSPIYLNMSR